MVYLGVPAALYLIVTNGSGMQEPPSGHALQAWHRGRSGYRSAHVILIDWL